MAKIKKKIEKPEVMQTKEKNTLQRKCKVKLRRLENRTRKINNTSINDKQPEKSKNLESSVLAASKNKVTNLKKCAVRLKKNLPEPHNGSKVNKSDIKQKQTDPDGYFLNSDKSASVEIGNVSNDLVDVLDPVQENLNADKVAKSTVQEDFETPKKKLRNLRKRDKELNNLRCNFLTADDPKETSVHVVEESFKADKIPKSVQENFKTPTRRMGNLRNKIFSERNKQSEQKSTELNDDDVYEFPSQSSISEREDPASEVVQKLIKIGRVSVAKHIKGKGRPRRRAAPKTKRNFKKPKINNGPPEKVSKLSNTGLPKVVETDLNSSIPNVYHMGKAAVQESAEPIHRSPVMNKQKLLEAVKKIVKQSTPIRKQNVAPIGSPFSPIPIKSPWRPAEETLLPRVFYFSRNEDNLPSYSSDVIPSSQVVERSRRSNLNHSDIENINPNKEVSVINDNPRKVLTHRSPLKNINILDVVILPRKSATDKSLAQPFACKNPQPLGNKNSLKNLNEKQSKHIDPANFSLENCFGFEDNIENSDDETSKVIPDKSQLITRLKNLQRLCPQKSTKKPLDAVGNIYQKVTKQKDIRDVLSSTFQEMESNTNSSNINFNSSVDISAIPEEDQNNSNYLFDDLDKSKTLDSTAHLRTYVRHPRKRRYSLYLSDEEEEVEEEEVQKAQKPKRTKAAQGKSNKELKKFIEEFNSMCDEVAQYQLHVERV